MIDIPVGVEQRYWTEVLQVEAKWIPVSFHRFLWQAAHARRAWTSAARMGRGSGKDGERQRYSDSVGRDAAGFPASALRSGRGAELWLGRSKKAHRKHRRPEEIEIAG